MMSSVTLEWDGQKVGALPFYFLKCGQLPGVAILKLVNMSLKFRFSGKATKTWLLSNVKTKRKIAPKFCGLLRIYELYQISRFRSIESNTI